MTRPHHREDHRAEPPAPGTRDPTRSSEVEGGLEMERVMSEAAMRRDQLDVATIETVDPPPSASASFRVILGPDPAAQRASSDEEMARLMGAASERALVEHQRESGAYDQVWGGGGGKFIIGAAAVLLVGGYILYTSTAGMHEEPVGKPARGQVAASENRGKPISAGAGPQPRALSRAVPAPKRVPESSREDGSTSGDQGTPRHASPKGLRQAPPGTPPKHVAALERLPVVSSDKPPVGGIGASGIHLDALALGTTYDESGCSGHDLQFSVRRGDRVSVCFRVVHPRKEEKMAVLWQKDGKTVRRTKLTIEPTHSYKTRAHLKLRRDHIGTWKVRLFSSDRTELGAQTFEVVR